MTHRSALAAATFSVLSLLNFTPAHADWPLDGRAAGALVGSSQVYPQVVSDGAGGAIVAWVDGRTPSSHIYAQRIDGFGNPLWTVDGIPVCPSSNYQFYGPQLIADNAGGAIVVWEDARINSDIYAQRVDPNGNLLWNASGVIVCTTNALKKVPQLAPDGSGGAYIVWQDERSGNKDIYAQRLDANGNPVWAASGVAACTDATAQETPEITSDALGAYMAWKDMRAGNYDIYATRISPNGTNTWAANGSVVCTATGTQEQQQLIPNGFGGTIVVWRDLRSGGNGDIYFQLLNAVGNAQFTPNGVVVSTVVGDKRRPQIVPDGNTAGSLIVWEGYLGGWDIYAQRIKSSAPLWGTTGVVVCSVPYNEESPQIIHDGHGGAIVAWTDSRLGWEYEIYAQRLDGNGVPLWTANGVILCQQPNNQVFPQLVSDGSRGAIVCWYDFRNFNDYDVYAQRIEENGYWGYPSPDIRSVRDVPGDQGGYANVAWYASRLDPLPDGLISRYTLWRAIPPVQMQLAVQSRMPVLADISDLDPAQTHSVLRAEEFAGVTYFWELVASVDAYHLDAYAKVVPTLFDSTATLNDPQYFQVIAHTSNSNVFWVSSPDSGQSIDNLAPAAPEGLAGKHVFVPAGLQLTWLSNLEADLAEYAVYRGTSPDFVPEIGNLVAQLPDTMLTDTGWQPSGGYYYKVSAIDIHGNEGPFALLIPEAVTDVDSSRPGANYLAQNVPNPFNPTTRISFGLKEPAAVSLRIYDAAGRLVRVLVGSRRPAGVHEETWDGRDNAGRTVASGVYFCRLEANAFTQTRKLVLLK